MKINWHTGFALIALGIGLLWIYSSSRAELILEFERPVRLQIADHSPYKSSRFVTVIPITNSGFPPLTLALETPGSRLRTIAVANRGLQVLYSPDTPAQAGTWIWDIGNEQWQEVPDASVVIPDGLSPLRLEFLNPPASLFPKTTEDFLLSTTLAFLALEAARFLLLALKARFRRLVFH